MAKTSRLDRPGYAEALAALLSRGLTNAEIAAEMGDGTHPDTVKKWQKDPRVQAILSRLREERVNRVTRKIDSVIEGRLSDPKQLHHMDVKDLITIRRELLGPQPQRVIASRGVDEAEAMGDLYARLARDPDLAEKLGMEGLAAPQLEAGTTTATEHGPYMRLRRLHGAVHRPHSLNLRGSVPKRDRLQCAPAGVVLR